MPRTGNMASTSPRPAPRRRGDPSAPGWPAAPMKAVPGELPHGDVWAFEPKWDGHRVLVRVRSDGIDAVSSSGLDRLDRWPWLASIRDRVDGPLGADAGAGAPGIGAPGIGTVLDGEVIAMDDDGRHSFGLVGDAGRPHAIVVFDVLAAGGRWIVDQPWAQRRALLEQHLQPAGPVMLTPTTDDGDLLWDVMVAQGYEGVVAKRRDSRYVPGGRSPSWRKVKIRHVQEFVVGGWLPGEGRRGGSLGALLLGVYDPSGDDGERADAPLLTCVGAVGSGFDDTTLDRVHRLLRPLATPEPTFSAASLATLLPASRRAARWVRPVLVAQVEFGEWTTAGHLRHPVFLGVRDDVDPATVIRRP